MGSTIGINPVYSTWMKRLVQRLAGRNGELRYGTLIWEKIDGYNYKAAILFPTKSAMGGIELLLRKKNNRKWLRWACYIFSYFLYFHKHPLGSYCTIRELIFLMCQAFSHEKMMCFFSGCSEECGRTQALKIPEKTTQMAIINAIIVFSCDIKIERKTLKWWTN